MSTQKNFSISTKKGIDSNGHVSILFDQLSINKKIASVVNFENLGAMFFAAYYLFFPCDKILHALRKVKF